MYCFLVLVPELESQRQKMFSVKKKNFTEQSMKYQKEMTKQTTITS